MNWFIENRNDVAERNIASMKKRGKEDRILLSLVNRERLIQILKRMLDETEFLSEHGIRSLSKYHAEHPFEMDVNGQRFRVAYVPGDSNSALFGGNSNWRGPVWIAVNFLLVESLLRQYMFYGDTLRVECPTGSGTYMHLGHVAEEIQHRLQHLYARGDDGRRAVNAGNDVLDRDEHFAEYLHFYEFFDGDSGRGLGASHQCGWTGLLAKMIHDTGVNCRLPQTPRTPSVAANHYFDDIFSRGGKGGRRRSSAASSSVGPEGGAPGARQRHRRSSTHRSIGNHSDVATVNGDADNERERDDEEVARSPRSTRSSIAVADREREEADAHVARYVETQLERICSEDSAAVGEDEFEAQLDES